MNRKINEYSKLENCIDRQRIKYRENHHYNQYFHIIHHDTI